MDAHSKKGLRKLELTEHALELWKKQNAPWDYYPFSFDYPAAVDYIITGDGVAALMEFRVRESGITLKELELNKSIILSTDKFNKCIHLSELLGTPVYFWVYLPNDGVLISWELYNAQTGRYVPFTHIHIPTRTSLNDSTKRNKPCIGLKLSDGKIILEGIDKP